MIVLTALLMAYVGVRLLLHPSSIADPQPTRPAREAELADRIDPNTADVHTLATLPGLGEKRAGDIVNHRERFERANPGQRAFTRAQDLLKIDGIGYAMMTQLAPYLLFSQEPSTDPAEEKR
jgi:DNA uptake protein ComE-like DNA-binding protein